MWYWIIGTKFVMEIFIYYFSVKPAYNRSVYQEFSKWKKGGRNHFKIEAQRVSFYQKQVRQDEILKNFKKKKINMDNDLEG